MSNKRIYGKGLETILISNMTNKEEKTLTHYVIIGGDAAGMSAAMEIVRHDKKAQVTTLEQGTVYSYGQCGLPYVIDGRIASAERVIARSPETFRDRYGIDARTNHRVESIDYEKKEVRGTHVETDETFTVHYDKLLIATGAHPLVPSLRNSDLSGIQVFKTIEQTQQLVAAIEEKQHVTVIGGGYIGLEVAEALTLAGKEVRVIQRGDRLAKNFDDSISEAILTKARERGIEVLLNEEVIGFEGEDVVRKVTTKNGTYATDYVVLALGVRPATAFAQSPQLHTLRNGAIVTNEQMETTIPDVYAAGDCASHFNRLTGKHDYIPLGTTANKQGRVAGLAMCGEDARFKGIVGTSIFQFFDYAIGGTGLNERALQATNRDYDSITLTANAIAGYYPGGDKMTLTLYYDTFTRHVLGAQMIGGAGVDKRLDVIATALYAQLTVEDLLDLDLSYAPPFNGVWDPIQQMARRLQR